MQLINNYFETIAGGALASQDLVCHTCDILNIKLVCNDGKVVDFEIEE